MTMYLKSIFENHKMVPYFTFIMNLYNDFYKYFLVKNKALNIDEPSVDSINNFNTTYFINIKTTM